MADLDRAVTDYQDLRQSPIWRLWDEEKRRDKVKAILNDYGVSASQLKAGLGATEAAIAPPSGKEVSPPPSLNLAPDIRIDPAAARMAGGMAGGALAAPAAVAGAPATGGMSALLVPTGYGLGGELAGQGAELINQFVFGSDMPQETPIERMGRAGSNVALDMLSGEALSRSVEWARNLWRGSPATGIVPKAGITTKQLRADYQKLKINMQGALASLSTKYARKIEALRGLPGSSGRIDRAINETFDDIGRTAWSLVDDPASAKTPYQLSQELEHEFRQTKNIHLKDGAALYNDAFAKMPKPFDMTTSIQWLSENPEIFVDAPQLRKWSAVLAKQEGKLSAEQTKSLMGAIRRVTGDRLILASQGIDIGAVKSFRTAVQIDIQAGAKKAGKDAVDTLARADTYYRQSQETLEILDDVLKGGEVQRAFRSVFEGIKDGPERLTAVKESVSPQLWRDIITTKILDIGNAPAGQRGVAREWSLNSFLTKWNEISPEAKDIMFGAGSDLRENWDALARIGSSFRNFKVVQNVSNTAHITAWQDMLAGTGWIWRHTGGAGLAYGNARLLTAPWFINWLTKGAELAERNPNGLAIHFGRLTKLVSEQPELADDIHEFIGRYGEFVDKYRNPTM